jgi:hypothetical protein
MENVPTRADEVAELRAELAKLRADFQAFVHHVANDLTVRQLTIVDENAYPVIRAEVREDYAQVVVDWPNPEGDRDRPMATASLYAESGGEEHGRSGVALGAGGRNYATFGLIKDRDDVKADLFIDRKASPLARVSGATG